MLGVRRGVICIELIGAYHFWNEAAWKMFSQEVGWIEFEVFGFGFDRGFPGCEFVADECVLCRAADSARR